MEIFTVDREYKNADLIDEFVSVIWTERYYGDSEVELVLPATPEMFEKVPLGILIGCSKSDELMMLEEGTIENGVVKYTGISLLSWLNNRFIRMVPIHRQTTWNYGLQGNAGYSMWQLVQYAAAEDSPMLNDEESYGLPVGYGERLKVPGLGLRDYDSVPNLISDAAYTLDFGPAYDNVRKIALAFEIGCKIDWKPTADPILGFRAYKGVDRTSQQTDYPVIRLSPMLDSLADIKELFSRMKYKNLAFTYHTNAPLDYTTPGIAWTQEASEASGLDLRAAHVLVDDIEDRPFPYDYIVKLLNGDAKNYLGENRFVRVIDGQIIPGPQLKYGQDYSLGDLVEEQGNTGAVSIGRITEYIRTQSAGRYSEYPTISEVETVNTNVVISP